MTPIVAVVGPAGSGKTFLLQRLLAELKGRGCRVALIKHGASPLELDKPGKDSWKFARAGAEVVLVCAPQGWAMFRKVRREWDLQALRNLLPPVELILCEGFRREPVPKLEIVPPGARVLSPPGQLQAIIGEAGSAPPEFATFAVPYFCREQVEDIADFLQARFLS